MRRRHRSRPARAEAETTVFFATDVHGSEVCFRKFVAAADFYGADLLVLGGDLTGKLVVPLVKDSAGDYVVEMHGERSCVRADQADALERQIADEGLYPKRMSAAEHDRLNADPDAVKQLFVELMLDRLSEWIDYANERLDSTQVRIITTPGNDDPPEVDDVIRDRGGDRVLLREGSICDIAPGHTMINTGYSNPTPWDTPREYPEDFLREHLQTMADRVPNPAAAIFNIHVPPHDSGLDTAPLLDEQLLVRTSMGAQMSAAVGSTAVREVIERYQPLISLHGHIHESGGTVKLGRTVAINPGSEYGEGVLRGVLFTIGRGQLLRYQMTTG